MSVTVSFVEIAQENMKLKAALFTLNVELEAVGLYSVDVARRTNERYRRIARQKSDRRQSRTWIHQSDNVHTTLDNR